MSEIAPLISDLAVILIAAGIITLVFKWLKQPVVLGYIVAGIIAGPAVPYIPTVSDPANIKIWADIGVIFLLFAMGLEFSFKKLMTVGGTAVIASITIVDVSRLCSRKRTWLLTYKQHIFRGYAFYVIHGNCIQGI